MITELVPVTLQLPDGGLPRSEGIHVSSVIRCIAAESGILKREYVESLELVDLSQQDWWERLGEQDRLLKTSNQIRIAIGMAWDHWYLSQLKDVIPHPGEYEVDGIYMTPDGESLDVIVQVVTQYGLVVHEAKATSKSTRTVGDLSSQWMWLAQTKSYCKALNTLVAYIHVLFLYGDYMKPYRPQLKVWRVTFTPEEINDNWALITGYVRHRLNMDAEDLMRDTEDAL